MPPLSEKKRFAAASTLCLVHIEQSSHISHAYVSIPLVGACVLRPVDPGSIPAAPYFFFLFFWQHLIFSFFSFGCTTSSMPAGPYFFFLFFWLHHATAARPDLFFSLCLISFFKFKSFKNTDICQILTSNLTCYM